METERLTLPGLLLAFTEVVSMAVDNDINLSRYSDGQITPPLDGVSKIMWRVLVGDVMLIANLILHVRTIHNANCSRDRFRGLFKVRGINFMHT